MKFANVLVMTAAFVFSALSQSAPGVAQSAPSPEALAAAQELAMLSSGAAVAEVVTTMTNQVWPVMEAAIRVKNPIIDPGTIAGLRREFEQLEVNAVREVMHDGAPVYARYFTVKELREMIAFYKTPTGSKALSVMPRAGMEILQGIAPRLQTLSDTVNQRFAAILKERGYQP